MLPYGMKEAEGLLGCFYCLIRPADKPLAFASAQCMYN